MQELEMSGRTVDEAIDKAVHQLGVGREDVEVVVVDKGRAGILGLGAEQARVRVSVRAVIGTVDVAKSTLEDLLRAMSVDASVGLPERSTTPTDDKDANSLSFNIDGEDAGLLIGRRGETLSSLQFIVNYIVSRKTDSRVNVSVDVEGYRERRNELLRSMAMRMAERAIATGRSVAMEPMPARERRIVHMALAEHGKVTTESVGDGEDRRITIIPKRGVPPPSRGPLGGPGRPSGPGGRPSGPGGPPRRPAPRYPQRGPLG